MMLNGLVVLGCFYVAFVGALYVIQRKLVFMPDTARVAPASVGLAGMSEEVIPTADGGGLVAWWSAPKGDRPVVLDLQGQAGAPSWRDGTIRYFTDAGYGVLTLAYPGYGGSSGTPSEAAIVAAAKSAYDWLRHQHKIESRRIVVFGESLGTGVAVQVAAEKPVAGVILDSAYTSLVDVAAGRFPLIPVEWLMSDPFDSMASIGKVRASLLMIHGTNDAVVPYALGQRLFSAATAHKQFVTIPGGGHTVHFSQGPWAAIKPFLAEIEARARVAQADVPLDARAAVH